VSGRPAIDPKDPALVRITRPNSSTEKKYELAIRNLTDKSGNKLPATAPIAFGFLRHHRAGAPEGLGRPQQKTN